MMWENKSNLNKHFDPIYVEIFSTPPHQETGLSSSAWSVMKTFNQILIIIIIIFTASH